MPTPLKAPDISARTPIAGATVCPLPGPPREPAGVRRRAHVARGCGTGAAFGTVGALMSAKRQALFTCASVLVAALAESPGTAHAQTAGRQGGLTTPPKPDDTAPPPAPPRIEIPKVVKDPGAVYPREALEAHVREPVTVVLVLELDAEGKVTKATVEAPQGKGFDEAAVAAAKTLELTPAKRDGKPIPAKIKHSYTFVPPAGRLVGKVASSARDTSLANVPVVVTLPNGEARTLTTAADGTFTLPDAPAGTYKVSIDAEGFVPTKAEETIEPGEEVSLTLRLDRPALKAPELPPGTVTGPIEEVSVRGQKPPREVTKRTFTQRELSRIPGTNGDALRAIQNFPGVARPPGLAGLLIVRGSAPNETNVFVDGTLVPLVYHFGGLSSVIPTEMLEKIDFYPGNFSAQYGRVVGGIVDVGLRNPKKKFHGMAQVDLIDARFVAEGPIFDTGWTFALGGRRSYVDLWLKPVLEAAGAGVSTAPVYYDYQAILQKDLGKNQSFRFAFFGSDDRLEVLVKGVNASNPGLGGNISFGTAFYRFQGRYENRISNDTQLKVTAAVGKDAIAFQVGDNFFTLDSMPIMLRTEVTQKLGQGVKTNFGLDWLYTPYTIDLRLPPIPRPGEPPGAPFGGRPPLVLTESDSTYVPGIYDEVEITPWKGGRIVTGLRVDYTKATQKWDVSPRVVARQDVTTSPRTTLKGGLGVFRQPPQPQDTARVFGIQGLSSNRAVHYSVGVEREVTKQIEVSVEGFYRDLDNLVVPRVGNVGTGRAIGAETLVRYKPDDRFFGFLAYTLSRSVRKDGPNEEERIFPFDQTHILTALGSYRLGDGWEIGARYRLISGSMRTPLQYGFFDLNVGAYLPLQSYPPNSERNPLFHQLDVRLDKTWFLKNGGKIGFYVDILNVYNQANSEGVTYNYNSTLSTQTNSLPILPSLGLRGEL